MITLTKKAATRVKNILAEKNLEDHGLRVFIQGGGCSGYEYGMAFENEQGAGDQVMESNGVRLFVDAQSLMHLDGSEIDYTDSLMGGGFEINNPNAAQSCACGQSFKSQQAAGGAAASSAGCGH